MTYGAKNDRKRRDRAKRRIELRAYLVERSGHICEWPTGRPLTGEPHAGEEMAHIEGTGLGGRASSDTPGNVIFLCRYHHDILDGRRRLVPAIDTVFLIGPGVIINNHSLREYLIAHVEKLRRLRGETI